MYMDFGRLSTSEITIMVGMFLCSLHVGNSNWFNDAFCIVNVSMLSMLVIPIGL